MSALTERIAATGRCGLWLDYTAYAGRLLANGAVPWLDADAAGGWMRKAQSLLKSDVAVLPVAAVMESWLSANPALAAAMAAKRRVVFPLKTLLADEALRAHLVELARVLRAHFDKLPLVLALPSPRRWVALAYAQAFAGETAEIDADAVDGAAAYIADFLRAFADCRLDGLLLQENAESAPASAEDLALYQPLFNVAAHYRWDAGLQLPAGSRYALNGGGPAFVLAAQAIGLPAGVAVPSGFWDGEAPTECAAGDFRYAEIPADARPENVLERLAALR
jgi:hypothetical protein